MLAGPAARPARDRRPRPPLYSIRYGRNDKQKFLEIKISRTKRRKIIIIIYFFIDMVIIN